MPSSPAPTWEVLWIRLFRFTPNPPTSLHVHWPRPGQGPCHLPCPHWSSWLLAPSPPRPFFLPRVAFQDTTRLGPSASFKATWAPHCLRHRCPASHNGPRPPHPPPPPFLIIALLSRGPLFWPSNQPSPSSAHAALAGLSPPLSLPDP